MKCCYPEKPKANILENVLLVNPRIVGGTLDGVEIRSQKCGTGAQQTASAASSAQGDCCYTLIDTFGDLV